MITILRRLSLATLAVAAVVLGTGLGPAGASAAPTALPAPAAYNVCSERALGTPQRISFRASNGTTLDYAILLVRKGPLVGTYCVQVGSDFQRTIQEADSGCWYVMSMWQCGMGSTWSTVQTYQRGYFMSIQIQPNERWEYDFRIKDTNGLWYTASTPWLYHR